MFDNLYRKILIAIYILITPYLLFSSNWPMIMGDMKRTGYIGDYIALPLNLKCSFDIQGDVVASPVVYDNTAYIGSRNGFIYALDENCNLVWDYSADGFFDATPYVTSTSVIVPSMEGYLYNFNRLTGDIIWQYNLGAPSVSSPLVIDGKVYVGAGVPENAIYIIDEKKGTLIKKISLGQPVNSTISSDRENVYFGANDGSIYVIDKNNNLMQLYTFGKGAFNMNAVSISSNSLFSLPGHDDRKLYKNSKLDGTLISQTSDLTDNTNPWVWDWQRTSTPLISSSTVYALCGSYNYYLIGINKNDLSEVIVSSVDLGMVGNLRMIGSAVMSGDKIFLLTPEAKFKIFSSTGAILQDISLSTSSYSTPAISNGYVYIAENNKFSIYKPSKYISFYKPNNEEVIYDIYSIIVNILDTSATSYMLEYALNDGNENYVFLSSGIYDGSEKRNYLIYNWDTKSLSNGEYLLRLTLFESSGNSVDGSVRFFVNQKPSPPNSLTASDYPNDNGNRIILTWNASSSFDIIEYRIYRSSTSDFELIGSTSSLSYLDLSAITGTTFTYKVTAYDGYLESDYSNTASAYSINDNPLNDNTPPSAVNNLIAEYGPSGGSVLLKWNAPGDDDTIGRAYYYTIKYSTQTPFNWDSAMLWKEKRSVSGIYGTPETEIVEGLFSNLTYYFAIKSYDYALNESSLSNIATGYPTVDNDPPSPPSGLKAYDTPGDKGGRITLEWILSGDDGAGDNDVYGYKIFRSTVSGVYDLSDPYATVGKGVSGYIDENAFLNVKYYYKVGAFDSTNLTLGDSEVYAMSKNNWRYVDSNYGGSIIADDGVEVHIPPNSINQNDYLLIKRLSSSEISTLSTKYNTKASSTKIIYSIEFEKSTTKLLSRALIKLPYTDSDIAGMNEENLRIYKLVGDTWYIVNTSNVLASENKVSAYIDSLGIFAIMEYIPSGELVIYDEVYTYPNPARGNELTFKFRVGDKSDVVIEVFNIAGEMVAKLEKQNCPAGVTSEIKWNIENIASGVYMYRLKAYSASGKKIITKKLAIIH